MQTEQQYEENGNGKSSKGPSLLDEIHDKWVKAGSKQPDKETSKKIFDRVRTSELKVQALEKQLEAARKEQQDAARDLVVNFGKQTFEVKDVGVLIPSCRNDVIYLRKERLDREVVRG